MASASVHLAECGTTLVSGFSHWRFGNVDWAVVSRIAIPGAVGGFLGATVLTSLSTEAAAPWMAALLFALGAYVISRFVLRQAPVIRVGTRPSTRVLAPLGLFAGFVDATGGGGWGPVATPTLLSSRKMDPRKVIGSVSAAEFAVTVAASLGFLIGLGSAGIDYRVVVGLLLGGMIAAPFAAWFVHRIPLPMLGALVGGIILVTNARTFMRSFEVEQPTVAIVYVLILAVWVGAFALAVRRVRETRRGALVPETV